MSEQFPFELQDIKGWVIKRKDGTTVRYHIVPKGSEQLVAQEKPKVVSYGPGYSSHRSFSAWCKHEPDPAEDPIYTNGKINLYIADSIGARNAAHKFDVCIDGGNVLTVPGENDLPNIYGDKAFARKLHEHVYRSASSDKDKSGPRIIKLRWADRCPPPVFPSFWPALLKELEAAQEKMDRPINVLTICQGGHGRSGSALVALMMCMTDYSPLDALTHIRALHCARAIESKDQHQYLNLVARELGREENAMEAEQVKSFKDRFLTLNSPVAEPYKSRVKGGKGATVDEREGSYL